MASLTGAVLLQPLLLAIALHEFVLRRVEVDHLVLHGISICTAGFLILVQWIGFSDAFLLSTIFWGSLSIWTLLYRAFWHPLNLFPGPYGAKLSKWWTTKNTWTTRWHMHRVHQVLHSKYGDYVRTGPREISVYDPAAIGPILGLSSKSLKGPFYDIMEETLHMNRNQAFHKQRRRIWDNAMKNSLSDYAPRVEEFTDQLLNRLRNANGMPVLLLECCAHYSYDVMSDLAFGKPMGFIKGEQNDVAESILKTLSDGLDAMGLIYHVPWFMNAISVLTSIAGPLKAWRDWSVLSMSERLALETKRSDIVEHLINKTPKTPEGNELLYGESRLIISAGSETTATALTFILVQLATHPSVMHSVRKEYRESQATYSCQRSLPFLDAVIHESMRLWPSLFFLGQRVTPPEGLQLGSTFIPGNTIVQLQPFVIHRDPRSFVRPDEFIPERWTTRRELVLNKDAFFPFSTGPYDCVGKRLAYMEMRSVITKVVGEFDVCLPEDFKKEVYWGDVRDHITAAAPPDQEVMFLKLGASKP
ncbi:cytochrome P450 [Karstenula rhodostoma CBS 690.94]|uniref:Cytochrome P450 n=1 Tax=Karstenula rhodostoma CBS 690.94 TaxID=1392251 RepID=A0A9P4PI17_9PLEO|nr:cytochrome P450 [Karstenula rhodostoma CBS 690.94]